ncbi:MAG: hypothetical protein M0Z76_02500 [Gammaproteobacteria bacterium]|nr:hypothetical protein [Gammaproteobacteria bacterium]
MQKSVHALYAVLGLVATVALTTAQADMKNACGSSGQAMHNACGANKKAPHNAGGSSKKMPKNACGSNMS